MTNTEWIITVHNCKQDDYYIISAPTANMAIEQLCIEYAIDDDNCSISNITDFISERKTAYLQI